MWLIRRLGLPPPLAITRPCRTIMKLCSVLILSAAATKSQTAREDMPCASGELRGRESTYSESSLVARRSKRNTSTPLNLLLAVPAT